MLYSYDDGRHDDIEYGDELEAQWIEERAQKLMYDHDWLYDMEYDDLDKENWRENMILFTQLPILLMDNLHLLSPFWSEGRKNKKVNQLIEKAEKLYKLIQRKAEEDAKIQIDKELGCGGD